MTDQRLTRTGIDTILARLKNPDEITAKMDRDRVRLACEWGGNTPCDPVDLVAALLDLVQRQDERIAGLEGVIRAQEAMIQAALEPVGVNGPPWDHHAAEDAADLILALRADNKRLREALE